MVLKKKIFCAFVIMVVSLFNESAYSKNVLIYKENLTYKGAFRVPMDSYGNENSHLGYGGAALTYNPSNDSFFIIGHPSQKMLFEISHPEPIISENIEDLNRAEIIQMPIDITNGNWNNLKEDGGEIETGGRPGGFLIHSNRLIGSVYAYYDGGHDAARSHFTASLSGWSSNGAKFKGMFKVGIHPFTPDEVNGGFVGGYMTHIPREWQPEFGGPALTGMSNIAIIGRSSLGPCLWVFNPDYLGELDPAPAEFLLGYPTTHPTLGGYNDTSLYNNMSTKIQGVVFPSGTDSILFFGRHGYGFTGEGDGCYGIGTNQKELHGTLNDDGVKYCYDPANTAKGAHAYPYFYRVWAYNANDLMKVKEQKVNEDTEQPFKPWDIEPYAIWNLDLPFSIEWAQILGAAYDARSQRIYISQYGGERAGFKPLPLIHAFYLDMDIPSPVKNLRINAAN